MEHVDTSAPRKLRHCKDEANLTSTPPQESSVTLSTPTTSKNSNNINSVTNVAVPDTPTTPKVFILLSFANKKKEKELGLVILVYVQVNVFFYPQLTIKPMGPQPSAVEPVQTAESMYSQSVNNITITTREGSPKYMVASADGTEPVSQRSGKKRRRYRDYMICY